MPTTKTLRNPTAQAHPDPINLDDYIEQLRSSIATIPWLSKAFHRAYQMPQKNPDGKGGIIQVPMAYQAGGEYYPVMPNDALQAYSFFRVRGPKTFTDYSAQTTQLYSVAPLDLIVWANLKSIAPLKDYIFTEELERHVMKVFNQFAELNVLRIWDERAEDIFSGYTLDLTKRDLLMYPYQAFRVEFDMSYPNFCLDVDPATRTRIFDYTFDETFP